MITPFHLQSIAEMSAAHIAASLIEGTVIAVLAAIALRLTRQQNSSARFATWFAALMTIAALPVFSALGVERSATAPVHSTITLPAAWALYVFAAWAAVSALLMARIGVSLMHVRSLRRSCVEVDAAGIDPLLRETLTEAGKFRAVALCTSAEVQVPTAIGFFDPAVVIPAWLLQDLSAEELNQILLHELAHLRRRDDWTNLLQQVVKALFFFHPAVWWIEKKISLEREMACDDAVLAATEKPRAYAECLAHLAERTFIRRSLALAQAALGRVKHTSLRVAQILNPNRTAALSAKNSLKPALALIAICGVGSAVVAAREPQLVAFQDVQPATVASHRMLPTMTSSPTWPMLKPIPASFVTPSTSSHTKSVHPHATLRAQNKSAVPTNVASKNFAPTNLAPIESAFIFTGASMFHLTASADSASETQTVFFVVEHNDAGQITYQIQMWRVTVFHPTAPPAAKIPNKET